MEARENLTESKQFGHLPRMNLHNLTVQVAGRWVANANLSTRLGSLWLFLLLFLDRRVGAGFLPVESPLELYGIFPPDRGRWSLDHFCVVFFFFLGGLSRFLYLFFPGSPLVLCFLYAGVVARGLLNSNRVRPDKSSTSPSTRQGPWRALEEFRGLIWALLSPCSKSSLNSTLSVFISTCTANDSSVWTSPDDTERDETEHPARGAAKDYRETDRSSWSSFPESPCSSIRASHAQQRGPLIN